MDRTELAGCPKCGVGPGVRKENATPARWIECTACGFVLGSFEETWAELAALSQPDAAMRAVGWQRRKRFPLASDAPGKIYPWEPCGSQEATSHFDKTPGYEYREIYALGEPKPVYHEELCSLCGEPYGPDATFYPTKVICGACEP